VDKNLAVHFPSANDANPTPANVLNVDACFPTGTLSA